MNNLRKEVYLKLSYYLVVTGIMYLIVVKDAKPSDVSLFALGNTVSLEESTGVDMTEPDTVVIEEPVAVEREPTSVDSWPEDETSSVEE